MFLKTETRQTFKFQSVESCALLLEGLRALRLYEQETERRMPSRARLDLYLSQAYDKLDDCVRLYADDRLPHFYLGITLTLKNQDDYIHRLLKIKPALQAEGAYLVFREASRLSDSAPQPANESPSQTATFLRNTDSNRTWYKTRAAETETASAAFRTLGLQPWPLLDRSAECFEHVQSAGPVELHDTAAYNLAQVYSRRGGDFLAQGLAALDPRKFSADITSSSSSADARALFFQIEILKFSLVARQFHRVGVQPSPGDQSKFDSAWTSLEKMPEQVQSSKLSASFQNDLQTDCLVKSGYVRLEQALSGRFTDDPLACLDDASDRFEKALSARKSWNQAQLYLATALSIRSGAAAAKRDLLLRSGLKEDGFSLSSEDLMESADKLFAALTGPEIEQSTHKQPVGLEG